MPVEGTNDIVLREADVVNIAFPGAENLNTTQTIRRDGKITLPDLGEVAAAGKTPSSLQKELVGLYAKELVSSKDIRVLRFSRLNISCLCDRRRSKTGKLLSDHPMTVLEAIMESGGFDYARANTKAVKVIRTIRIRRRTIIP